PAAALEVGQRVEPAEPPLLAVVEPGQAAVGAPTPRLDDDWTQLHRVDVEQHGERQRLAALERDLAVVGQAVAIEDADRLPSGWQPGEGENPRSEEHTSELQSLRH